MIVPFYAYPAAAAKAPAAIVRDASANEPTAVASSGAETSPSSGLVVYTADSTGEPVLPAVPKWDAAAARRFQSLAVKYALGTITPEERGELTLLGHSRDAETPGMSYEEFKRHAEMERTRAKLLKDLADYVAARG